MTLVQALALPAVKLRYLAQITGSVLLQGWVLHSGAAYKTHCAHTIESVIFNASTALTARASIAAVIAAAGWFQDTDGTVYVRADTGQNLFADTFRGRCRFYFSKGDAVTVDNRYYESRLDSVPALSLRIEPRFSGVSQVGTGNCSLINNDGFFDELDELHWETAQFFLGADTATTTMAFADYEEFGVWKIEDTRASVSSFEMSLVEPKAALSTKIPLSTFNRTDYPNIADVNVGKVIPRLYGVVYAVPATCVDASAKRFKIADHALYEITEARILSNNVWTAVPFASKDEANAEFTLGAAWANNESVCVDVIGRKRSGDGLPMYNASEIVEDLLAYIGEANLNSAAFDAAFDALDVGAFVGGIRRTSFKPSLYIGQSVQAREIISKINNVAGSFLFINASGQWHYEVFEPKVIGAVDKTFTDEDIVGGPIQTTVDTSEMFSSVNVKYGERYAESWTQNVEASLPENQFIANAASELIKETTVPLFDTNDATHYAQRILTTEGRPLKRYRFAVTWAGFLLQPGDQIKVDYDIRGISEIMEVLEARHDLDQNRIQLICGDRRGWRDSFGFWVSDATSAWNPAATDAEKRTADQTAGYHHGDDDLAVSTDSKSFKNSRHW